MTAPAPAPRGTERRASGLSGGPSIRAARGVDLIVGRLGIAKPVIFVSGFWRSGTTWLQQLLADSLPAKTVFEPLCPLNPIWRSRLTATGLLDYSLQEAFIPGRKVANDCMWTYLDAAFHAVVSSDLSMICRTGVGESFRRAIVVKDVRLQLNLDAIHHRYGVPVVHLRRHPCAVVSSLMSADWPWSFDHVRMADLVAPFIDELRDESLPNGEALDPFDGDAVSRIAAFWALTECLTERRVRNHPWATILAYEDALRDPAGTIQDLCRLIGRRPFRIGNSNLDSVTTRGASRGTPTKLRAQAWRDRLSTADIDRAHQVVAAIFPQALAGLSDRAA